MDFKKALAIALRGVQTTFGDRNLLLIMVVAPLAITLIIGAAFSKFVGPRNDLSLDISVGLVNEDQGTTILNQPLNYGDIITGLLVPPTDKTPDPNNTLFKLLKAQKMSRTEAIVKVDKGNLTAAIIIPAGFSESLNPTRNDKPIQTTITLYRAPDSSIAASIVSSVIRGIVNNLASGNIAIFAAKAQVSAGKASPLLLASSQQIEQTVRNDLQAIPPITLVDHVVGDQQQTANNFDPLQYFAPSMAVFFLTFTMAGSASSIIEEQTAGTLQRMLSSPTSRTTILVGKLGGTYVTGLLQLTVLIFAMALLGPILGSKTSVWGNNIPGLILITLSATAAATGLGALLAGLARSAQQADVISNAVLIALGMVGGAFFDVSTLGLQGVSKLTPNYWATNAYTTLARTNDLSTIFPNVAVLLVIFVVLFGIGLLAFNRRLKNLS